jgi:hypothetical protein
MSDRPLRDPELDERYIPSPKPKRMRGEQHPSHHGGRITAIEVVAYTAVLGLIAALASGWFDAMVPWK